MAVHKSKAGQYYIPPQTGRLCWSKRTGRYLAFRNFGCRFSEEMFGLELIGEVGRYDLGKYVIT